MNKIAVRKSDGRLVSFGSEDMSRFDPATYDIMEIQLARLPDELRFCIWENGQIVVDTVYKQQVLGAEAQKEQEREEAKQHITLDDLAGLTNQKIVNYVNNNVTDLASAKSLFIKIIKWNRALTRIAMVRQDD